MSSVASMSIAGGDVMDFERAFVNAVISNGRFLPNQRQMLAEGCPILQQWIDRSNKRRRLECCFEWGGFNGDIYTMAEKSIFMEMAM